MKTYVFLALLIGICSLGISCTNTGPTRTSETDGGGMSPLGPGNKSGTSADQLKGPENVSPAGTTTAGTTGTNYNTTSGATTGTTMGTTAGTTTGTTTGSTTGRTTAGTTTGR